MMDETGFKALVTVLRGHEDLAERWFAAHDVTVEVECTGLSDTVGDPTFSWYVVTGRGAVLETMQRTRMFVDVAHRMES